ncbi:MAG: CHAT domain-containing protein [Chloroflexi bacterium]|nr:CHAT domain-containing protein [Chloroflexota bacterium]
MGESSGFTDVDIRAENSQEVGRYPVSIETTAGDASDTLLLDPADESFQNDLAAIESGKTPEDFFLKFGERLFTALMPDPVAATFRAALGRARGESKRLRVRLRLRPPELSALPWEYLYDPQQDLFLAISSNTVLSRYVVNAPAFAEPTAVTPPLRLLVAFASPSELPPLDIEKEREWVTKATQRAADAKRLELHFVDHLTTPALRSALRDVRPHIFHFVGHGEFDEGHGYLIFEDDYQDAQRIRDRTLREFFEDAPDTKLVVLNACNGATSAAGQAISGLAPFLVQRGLPAVVAMRYPVPDRAALVFAREFYEALTQETPTGIDVAAAAGRRAIYQDFSPDRRDWGVPNVYLRAEDGTIFAPPKAAEAAVTEKPAGKQEGGVNFSGIGGNISIGGDLVGRDKITKNK